MALFLLMPTLIPMLISIFVMIALILGFYRMVSSIFLHMRYYFQTRFEPKVVHVSMSDDEIKRKYREMDNKENGFNPMRQAYAHIELFPKVPDLEKVKEFGAKLFPNLKFEDNKNSSVYINARSYFLMMLIERSRQVENGTWNTDKEKKWTDFPCRPKQMAEIDGYYLDWAYEKMGTPRSKTNILC